MPIFKVKETLLLRNKAVAQGCKASTLIQDPHSFYQFGSVDQKVS